MSSNKIQNVLICDLCVMYIANGELPADSSEEEDQDIIHGASYLDIKYKFGSVGEFKGYSIQPCECCGSKLHGNRHEYDNAGLYF